MNKIFHWLGKFVKTELNHKELNDFINLWKDKVDMIGIQEFVKPTKVTKEITGNRQKRDKKFQCRFHSSS